MFRPESSPEERTTGALTICWPAIRTIVVIIIAATVLELSAAGQPYWPGQPKQWQNVGPRPIVNDGVDTWQNGTGPLAGRVEDIAVDPVDLNHWLIATMYGGIWSTRDGGTTWRPVSDDAPILAMGAVAFAPSYPLVAYAGTGSGAREKAGRGLLKSYDGGDHWFVIATVPFINAAFREIQIQPDSPDTLLVATKEGALGHKYTGVVDPYISVGIFKSRDGGHSWRQTLKGPATDVKANPNNYSQVYAAIAETYEWRAQDPINYPWASPPQSKAYGLWRSLDAGETWNHIVLPDNKTDIGHIRIAIAPTDPNVVYVAVLGFRTPPGVSIWEKLWRTGNAWAASPQWTQITNNNTPMCEADKDCPTRLDLLVDLTDKNTLFGTSFLPRVCTNCATSDAYWKDLGRGRIHIDQAALAWIPSTGRLLVVNDGGVYSTTDMGLHWNNHNQDLAISQFEGGAESSDGRFQANRGDMGHRNADCRSHRWKNGVASVIHWRWRRLRICNRAIQP